MSKTCTNVLDLNVCLAYITDSRAITNGNKLMKIYKAITFAYPTSPTAVDLGMSETGCWYVQQTLISNEQCHTGAIHNAEGFTSPDHPDLIAFYHETKGEMDNSFRMYGNAAALRAVGGNYDGPDARVAGNAVFRDPA